MSARSEAAGALAFKDWLLFPLHCADDGVCSCGNPEHVWPDGKGAKTAGKHPRTAHGVSEATSSMETVAAWWRRWPEANIGLATGTGLMVLDVDGPEGESSLGTLPELPPTLEATTGRGRHLYFEVPEGVRIVNRARAGSRLPVGLDVRGDGGYVVAPNSVHASGAVYRWVDSDLEPAPCPGWLLELVRARELAERPAVPAKVTAPGDLSAYVRAALNGEVQSVLDAAPGVQNDTLFYASARLAELVAGGELPEDVARRALLDAWDALEPGNGPGMRTGEKTIESGFRHGLSRPRTAPERSSPWRPTQQQAEPVTTKPAPNAGGRESLRGKNLSPTGPTNARNATAGETSPQTQAEPRTAPERPPEKRRGAPRQESPPEPEKPAEPIVTGAHVSDQALPNGARPHVAPEPVEYPLGVWPGQVAEFIQATAENICVEPAAVGTAVLAVAAAAIGRARWLDVKGEGGWVERPSIYAGLVGDVSRRKSPTLRAAKEPLEAIHREAAAKWAKEHEEWEDTPGKKGEPEIVSPLMKDITTEILAHALKAHPRGVALVADELIGWLNGMGQYKGGKGNDRQRWVEAWNGDTVDVWRVGKPRIVAERPCVSVVGGVQPAVFAGLTAVRDGLAERFLYTVMPKVELADTPDVPRRVRGTWEAVVRELYGLGEAEVACEVPGCLSEARKRLMVELNATTGPLEGYLGKNATHFVRIAIVLSSVWEVCDGERGLTTAGVGRAEDLWGYHANQAEALFCGDAIPVTAYEPASPAKEQAVLVYLRRHDGQALKRDLMRGPLQRTKAREAEEVLTGLVGKGQIGFAPGPRTASVMYVLL